MNYSEAKQIIEKAIKENTHDAILLQGVRTGKSTLIRELGLRESSEGNNRKLLKDGYINTLSLKDNLLEGTLVVRMTVRVI